MIADLLKWVDRETAGDPCSEEKWVRSRLRGLAEKLDRRACPTTIGRLLRDQKLGLRGHRKERHTGKQYEERDLQFRYIAQQRDEFRNSGNPRVSVDTKKKELIGQFKNTGQTWGRQSEKVNDHDFRSDAEAIAVPYGIYDPQRNTGHVCVGTSKDVPDFAADALEDWWHHNARHDPDAQQLMIEADAGGSNSAVSRQYKRRLQGFADSVEPFAVSRSTRGWRSPCAMIRPAPRNGIRWNIACSARSRPRGPDSSCEPWRSSWGSFDERPREPD